MHISEIETRIQEIRNELHSLDHLKDSHDDVNIHIIDSQIDALLEERNNLTDLLESCFDDITGL